MKLDDLLNQLTQFEQLPALDRWFSQLARQQRWPPSTQKRLWDQLRSALTRGMDLLPHSNDPTRTVWAGCRRELQQALPRWVALSQSPPPLPRTPRQAGIPDWLTAAWQERCQKSGWTIADQQRFLQRQDLAAPLYGRWLPTAEAQTARQEFRTLGWIKPVPAIPSIDTLESPSSIFASSAWKKGWLEIQDAASQLTLSELHLAPGQRLWDVCAGSGGKSFLAANALGNKGVIVCSEISEAKRQQLKERLRRSGWQNLRVVAWDGQQLPAFGREIDRHGGFDRVIVDAPCSASGTWRRDPEGRYRLTPAALTELHHHQTRLLGLGWRALKPGGMLAYITCSWLPSENEHIADRFSQEVHLAPRQQTLLGLPNLDANTMFVAIWQKPIHPPLPQRLEPSPPDQ